MRNGYIRAVVNGICIIFGTLLGKLFSRIPESMKGTIMHAIGLAVTVLGLQMALKSENFLVVILSLVIGTVIGEWLQLEGKLKQLGDWLENKVGSKGKGSISEGFVTATLILQLVRWGYWVHSTVVFAEITIFYLRRRLSTDLFLLY